MPVPVLDLDFVYRTLKGIAAPDNARVREVVIDSRAVRPGDIFAAVPGDHVDGHDFVEKALQEGAVLCLTSRADCEKRPGCLQVEDAVQALAVLGQALRRAAGNSLKVAGITGSAGKTTVKEMLAAILRAEAGDDAVLATAGNFNNHIGLPLTLLKLRPQHRYAVIEMGMNHSGELLFLTRLAAPDYALVNNALRAHVGCGFDGVADIAAAKSEIYEGLPADGVGFYPCDDSQVEVFERVLKGKEARAFGITCGDVRAEDIRLHPLSVSFVSVVGGKCLPRVEVAAPGIQSVHNALAAIAVALAAGADADAVLRGLAAFRGAKGRLQLKAGVNGARLIDDTYNANPDAFRAAIDVLAAFPEPRILVMGDIGELGDNAVPMHAEVGAYACEQGIGAAFFVGENARYAAEAYGADARYFDDKMQLAQAVKALAENGTTILVKGSRFMKMEEVADVLTASDQ